MRTHPRRVYPGRPDGTPGQPRSAVLIYDSTKISWVTMNAPRLKTKEVRQGFSYAFPYDVVEDGAYKGLLTRTSPIPDTVRGYDPEGFVYQTDLTKAKELILSGGFAEGDSFEYMLESEDEVEAVVAQLFQANVTEMGFQLELTEVDSAALNQLSYGDAPAEERPHFFGGWSWWPDYNDPWNMLAPNFLEALTGEGGANAGVLGQRALRGDHGRRRALHRRRAARDADEGSPEHPHRTGPAGDLLRPAPVVHDPARDIQGFHQPALPRFLPFYEMWRGTS